MPQNILILKYIYIFEIYEICTGLMLELNDGNCSGLQNGGGITHLGAYIDCEGQK